MLSKGWRRLEAEMPLTAATTSERHAAEPIEVIPSGRALGVEVRGIDLTKLGDAAFARLIQVWHQYSVVPIGSLGDGEAVWHTDMSYLEVPPKASILYSLEVPPLGGNTSFCTMYGIYEALPQKLKDRIAELKI